MTHMKSSSYLQRFDNVELAVRQRGSGIPLIWGHNLLGSIRVDDQTEIWDWEEMEQHSLVVRYDARGHGNSDGSYAARDYRWDHLARDMSAVAKSVTPAAGRYVLGGASMGCATALAAALQEPEQVAGLVLVLPPTAWLSRPKRVARYRWQAMLSGAFGATPYRLLDLVPARRDDENARRRQAATVARELVQANPHHVQAALQGAAMSDLPSKRKLRKLDIPALVLTWKDDKQHPVSTAKILADVLPNVESLVISSADDVSDWTTTVTRFLDKLSENKPRSAAA
jgi:3-oxoadipate enol-lactonase